MEEIVVKTHKIEKPTSITMPTCTLSEWESIMHTAHATMETSAYTSNMALLNVFRILIRFSIKYHNSIQMATLLLATSMKPPDISMLTSLSPL